MTVFNELERSDIVWASDPLSDKGRPMLVIGTPEFPSHGVQLSTVLMSTKTYHEDSLTLRDDYEDGPLGERSHVLPWSLATLTDPAEVEFRMTSLSEGRTDDVATQSAGYIS